MPTKHTPGPWTSDGKIEPWWGGQQPAVRVSYETSPGNSSPVAMCNPRCGSKQAVANAALIAAAPNLLKVAMNAVGAYDALEAVGASHHLPGFDRCKADLLDAIEKATP